MKNKLAVGMYVRTKEGTIHKIFKIDKMLKYKKEDRLIINKDDWFLVESDLFKASHSIIDLIEVGDYVNGYKVLRIEKDYLFDYREEINILIVQNDEVYEVAKKIYSDGIQSIVTKEQFENISYEVE